MKFSKKVSLVTPWLCCEDYAALFAEQLLRVLEEAGERRSAQPKDARSGQGEQAAP